MVLISKTGYSRDKNQILLNLIAEPIALFCAVGKDCQVWEEVMDDLCVGDGSNSVFIPTTSHPDETIEEVIEFARIFSVHKDEGVRILEA